MFILYFISQLTDLKMYIFPYIKMLLIFVLLMASNFSLVQWNAQGFNSHGPEFIWEMSNKNLYPSVICLQETFFSGDNDFYDINDYVLANYSTRNIKKGGTAIYCRSDVKFSPVKFSSNFELSAVEILFNHKKLLIVNLYDPNYEATEKDYTELVLQFQSDYILCGDFNSHHSGL